MSIINKTIQPFKANAYLNGNFVEVSNETMKGKWSVIIFMPAAFTFICPTEVEDAADNYAEFQKLGAEVYIVTTDTQFAHKIWHDTSPAVGKAKFPLVGDPTHQLTSMFDVHIDEEGLALRGTFILNPDGVVKTMEVHDNAIARDVKETLRKLQGGPVRGEEPERSLPGQVERRRGHADAVVRPRRQDLIDRPRSTRPDDRREGETDHARRQRQSTAARLPRPAAAPRRAGRLARRQRRGRRDARAARRDRRAERAGQRAPRRPTPSAAPRSRSRGPAPTPASPSRRFRWATSSPRWCWRCCRPAAIRPRSTDEVIEQIQALDGDYRLRDVWLSPATTARTSCRR